MTRISRIACLLALAAWVLPGAAHAQKRTGAKVKAVKEEAGYSYRFTDESLLGQGLGNTVPILKVRGNKGKSALSRPRTTFVPELVKSVENI